MTETTETMMTNLEANTHYNGVVRMLENLPTSTLIETLNIAQAELERMVWRMPCKAVERKIQELYLTSLACIVLLKEGIGLAALNDLLDESPMVGRELPTQRLVRWDMEIGEILSLAPSAYSL